jgi:Mg2+ and Co2+ transporter CorA
MATMETRLTRVEEKVEHQQEQIQESMIERRRQSDDTHQVIQEMQKDIAQIKQFIDQANGIISGVTKTVLIITTFFSAVGAAIWAIVDKLAPLFSSEGN